MAQVRQQNCVNIGAYIRLTKVYVESALPGEVENLVQPRMTCRRRQYSNTNYYCIFPASLSLATLVSLLLMQDLLRPPTTRLTCSSDSIERELANTMCAVLCSVMHIPCPWSITNSANDIVLMTVEL
ncbi:Uncharacterized protein TCM_036788 [Theobroma cacao]|uniref:Uncharacterized protein n=1 Tax=Theobroma cacao TaxID=3641 RepID=A0A061GH58_THECC|nr:Uncharacterized protein TCM_036788 [Theobroma cacao]